ncbi:MAG: hypothetical protein ABIJ18_03020, partial [archaeon]
ISLDVKEFGDYYISAFDCVPVEEEVRELAEEEERTLRDKLGDVFSDPLYLLLLILLLIIVVGIIIYLKLRHDHFKKVILRTDKFANLKYYAAFSLAKNLPIEQISNGLISNGWDTKLVKKIMPKLKKLNKGLFELSIYSKLASQTNPENIVSYFVSKGYRKKRVLRAIYGFKKI